MCISEIFRVGVPVNLLFVTLQNCYCNQGMQFSVLLSLRATQPTWRHESSHMTCCSSVLDLQTARKGQFGKFAFQLAITLLQPLRWYCVYCVIHHERVVCEEQKYICVARSSKNKRDATHDLCCCLLPRCEALRTCRSGFPIETKWCCDQDVEVVPSSAFTQRTCDRCGSL